MRPPDEVKKVLVRQWLEKAEQDMKASEALLAMEPPFLYPSCFHAQQAAEKYLKAVLTWHQIEFSKTHAIEQILDLLSQADADMASRLADASALSPYAVDVRYPGDQPEPNLPEAHRAVDLARQVRDAMLGMLPLA